MYFNFHFSILRWHRLLKSFLMEDKYSNKVNYHGCWCPWSDKSQDISSHAVDLILPIYSNLKCINPLWHIDSICCHVCQPTFFETRLAVCWCQAISSINSLWPSDAIWQHRSGSTLAQVMACCVMAPGHFLIQCWLIITKVQWHSSEGSFRIYTSSINH